MPRSCLFAQDVTTDTLTSLRNLQDHLSTWKIHNKPLNVTKHKNGTIQDKLLDRSEQTECKHDTEPTMPLGDSVLSVCTKATKPNLQRYRRVGYNLKIRNARIKWSFLRSIVDLQDICMPSASVKPDGHEIVKCKGKSSINNASIFQQYLDFSQAFKTLTRLRISTHAIIWINHNVLRWYQSLSSEESKFSYIKFLVKIVA